MCHALPYQPLWLPELNCLAGFKVTEKRNGIHVSSQNFTYPINTLRIDPKSVHGDHNRCLHFAYDPQTAKQNLLGSYGSHLLFCALIPSHYWSKLFKPQSPKQACLHGDLTVVLSCLTCGEGEYEEPHIIGEGEVESYLSYMPQSDPLDWVRQLPVVNS